VSHYWCLLQWRLSAIINCFKSFQNATTSKCDDFDVVFRSALDDVAAKVDFSRVKSCVAFGTGSGGREIEFARRLLPNLRSFTAVERDPESINALRDNFQDGQLPGVETSVVETSIESWSGVDHRVDAVLLLNMLSHIHTVDRKALFQKLMTQWLSSGGLVVISSNVSSIPTATVQLMERLGKSSADYDRYEKEMLAEGFRVVFQRDLQIHRDLSNPSDGVVKYLQMRTDQKFTESEIRAVINDIYSQPNMDFCVHKLAIFTK